MKPRGGTVTPEEFIAGLQKVSFCETSLEPVHSLCLFWDVNEESSQVKGQAKGLGSVGFAFES